LLQRDFLRRDRDLQRRDLRRLRRVDGRALLPRGRLRGRPGLWDRRHLHGLWDRERTLLRRRWLLREPDL
jgi:hypothetical protein